MNKLNVFYWIVTVLFAGFMVWSAIPDIQKSEKAIQVFKALGYPEYMIQFIGIGKLLGSLALLLPTRRLKWLKEWAYAGLFIDLVGATYSALTVFGYMTPMLIMLIPFSLGITSYILFRKVYGNDPGFLGK